LFVIPRGSAFIDDDQFHAGPTGQNPDEALISSCFDKLAAVVKRTRRRCRQSAIAIPVARFSAFETAAFCTVRMQETGMCGTLNATDLELNSWVQYEGWKAPIYKPGLQRDTTIAAQFTWYPKLHTYPEQH
jgi:hypothetical protein